MALTVSASSTPKTGCSTAVLVVTDLVVGDLTSALLLAAAATAGPLFEFLNTTFTNDADAETAFRNSLGSVTVRQTAGTAGTSEPILNWKAAASKPHLLITQVGTTDAEYELLIAIAHSVVR